MSLDPSEGHPRRRCSRLRGRATVVATVAVLLLGGIALGVASRPTRTTTADPGGQALAGAITGAYASGGVRPDSVSCAPAGDATWSCSLRVGGKRVHFRARVDPGGRWGTESFSDPGGDPSSEFVSGRALVGCCVEAAAP